MNCGISCVPHDLLHVRPHRVGALGHDPVALVEHLVEDLHALVGQPDLVGVGVHQRPADRLALRRAVPLLERRVQLAADVLDRLRDRREQRLETGRGRRLAGAGMQRLQRSGTGRPHRVRQASRSAGAADSAPAALAAEAEVARSSTGHQQQDQEREDPDQRRRSGRPGPSSRRSPALNGCARTGFIWSMIEESSWTWPSTPPSGPAWPCSDAMTWPSTELGSIPGSETTCCHAAVCDSSRMCVGDVAADGAEEDREEHRDAEGAADLPEEGRRAGGDADRRGRHRALHDQQQRLHAVAEARGRAPPSAARPAAAWCRRY